MQKTKTLKLTKGNSPVEHTVKIKPFKASRDRMSIPLRKRQGITISGWQFEVKSIQPNGTVNLRPVGRIIEDVTPVQAALKGALKKDEAP